ncbi:MAG: DUF721 domain-containing protein [Rickettsiales bacterium]|jgi:hypothetical protein|nr:DUF721 domain-containing protein [Rickettsiales bacterium]
MVEVKKIDFKKRSERPQFAFAAALGLLKKMGGNAFDSEIAADWPKIAGADYAADLSVKSLSKSGVLTLRVLVPAKITVLSYEGNEIMRRVNAYYKRDVVKKVSFRK